MTNYATTFTDIFDKLIAIVVATTTFTPTNTTGAFIKSWQGVTYPICMVRPESDEVIERQIGGLLEKRQAIFKIRIKMKGTGTQDNQDTIIGYVGEIIEKIRATKNLGSSYGTLEARDTKITYSLSEEKTAIFYYAVITVAVIYMADASGS